jgi:phage N-6-adenine-methyltransferase
VTLVGFNAMNHPQQIAKRGARPEVDERATSPEVFAPLHERFRFSIDVAALPHNAKCERFYTPDDDGLAQSWAGERVWCNPPYSSIEPWVCKAWREIVDDGRRYLPGGAELIVMLLPANRTEQGWWQRQVEPFRLQGRVLVEFLPGRLRFIAHDATEIRPNERPPFGCCLVIWGTA